MSVVNGAGPDFGVADWTPGVHRAGHVFDEMLIRANDGSWQGDSSAFDLTEKYRGGVGFDSEPDWQPIVQPANGQVPESPYLPALPAAAVLSAGSLLVLGSWRSRRRASRA